MYCGFTFKRKGKKPSLNEAFEDFCEHYSMTALPAKAYRPRYKALVEGVVKIIYTRIYAMLKLDMIHSLEELNQVIRTLLEEHNNKALTGRDYSRRQLFDEIEKEALQPLPVIGYEFKKRRVVTVSRLGYAALSEDKHYYHVPYEFKCKKVTVLYSGTRVDIFHHYDCIATYTRDRTPFMFTTTEAFNAPQHQFRKDWTPERMIERAAVIGPDVKDLVIKILEKPQHPDQSFKSCAGVLNFCPHMKISAENPILINHLNTNVMNDQTLEKMRRMKFHGMHRAFKTSLESGQLNALTADELIAFLVESEYDDRSNRRIEKQDLLIIDDFGLQPLDSQNRNMLLEIMEDRHGKRSTIITSQLPVVNWYDIIGEQTIADAILDRIVHDAHKIELNGESLRKRYGMKKEMDIITMQ